MGKNILVIDGANNFKAASHILVMSGMRAARWALSS